MCVDFPEVEGEDHKSSEKVWEGCSGCLRTLFLLPESESNTLFTQYSQEQRWEMS